MVYTHVPNRRRSRSPQPPRQLAQSRLQRERRGYPDQPVGIKVGGEPLGTQEVIANKVVAALGWRRGICLRPTRTDFIQVSLKQRIFCVPPK